MNTGVQMGGWFIKEVNTAEDFKCLRYRMPGLGPEVWRLMGATVVSIPGGEIMTALKSGAIDASEWVGPWLDTPLGLSNAADYYYFPGFHEPGTPATLGIGAPATSVASRETLSCSLPSPSSSVSSVIAGTWRSSRR
jgi:TRAP-type mannitol/chloroaromatic compound transport system substrate-binding protein